MTTMGYYLLFSLVLNNLTNYGRRHLKLCTNCHVSWDTLYLSFSGQRDVMIDKLPPGDQEDGDSVVVETFVLNMIR